jgi:hypothetical protein
MKKLLVILAIGAFAACNNAETTETPVDSTAVKPADTTIVTPAPADTTMKPADTTAKPDTTKK